MHRCNPADAICEVIRRDARGGLRLDELPFSVMIETIARWLAIYLLLELEFFRKILMGIFYEILHTNIFEI